MRGMARILAVTAHPDDESFLFGGALALHARRGDAVRLLCLTDGQAGRTGGLTDREGLGAQRRGELLRACALLGIGRPITPGLPDGALETEPRGAAVVEEAVRAFDPDVLLSFGPEGASGHPDHKAAWRWTRAAAGTRNFYAATFPAGTPPRDPLPVTTVVDVSELGDLKRRAFLEHRSQRDHLALFDSLMEAFGGFELYHRVHPAWPEGARRESGLAVA